MTSPSSPELTLEQLKAVVRAIYTANGAVCTWGSEHSLTPMDAECINQTLADDPDWNRPPDDLSGVDSFPSLTHIKDREYQTPGGLLFRPEWLKPRVPVDAERVVAALRKRPELLDGVLSLLLDREAKVALPWNAYSVANHRNADYGRVRATDPNSLVCRTAQRSRTDPAIEGWDWEAYPNGADAEPFSGTCTTELSARHAADRALMDAGWVLL